MNIRSLQNKLDDVQCFVMSDDCDLLLLTETWIKQNESFLYNLRNYRAVHSCRDGRGGGVSVYVKDTIRFCEIGKSDLDSKINWVCVNLSDSNLKISVVYRPPSFSSTEFQVALEKVLLRYPKNTWSLGTLTLICCMTVMR